MNGPRRQTAANYDDDPRDAHQRASPRVVHSPPPPPVVVIDPASSSSNRKPYPDDVKRRPSTSFMPSPARPRNLALPRDGAGVPRTPTLGGWSLKDALAATDRVAYVEHQLRKLLRRAERKTRSERRRLIIVKLVVVCAAVYVLSWIPYSVSN